MGIYPRGSNIRAYHHLESITMLGPPGKIRNPGPDSLSFGNPTTLRIASPGGATSFGTTNLFIEWPGPLGALLLNVSSFS